MGSESLKQPHDGVPKCGRSKRDGSGLCGQAAGWGTEHAGIPGKACKLHGGKSSGAPKGNANAVTTGEYQSIVLQHLDEDERAAWLAMPVNPKGALEEQLRTLKIREARMMKRLAAYRAREASGESSTLAQLEVVREVDEVGEEGSKTRTERETIATAILRQEDALTRVQGLIARVSDSLHKVEQDGKGDPDEGGMNALAAAIVNSTALLTGQGKGFEPIQVPNRDTPKA